MKVDFSLAPLHPLYPSASSIHNIGQRRTKWPILIFLINTCGFFHISPSHVTSHDGNGEKAPFPLKLSPVVSERDMILSQRSPTKCSFMFQQTISLRKWGLGRSMRYILYEIKVYSRFN